MKTPFLQLNIEGLTASKMNVIHNLALQSEALVILLQETHCTDAEKLVLPSYQLAGFSLSRNTWPCHVCPRATEIHAFVTYKSPRTSEIKWLCVDVDGYKIVNVYKPPPTRLRSLDLPVFPHPCLYTGDFNCRHADWGYNNNSPDGDYLAGWASINNLVHLYNAKNAASFYSGRWNTGTNLDLAFTSEVLPAAYRINVSLKSSPGHNIDLRLLHQQGLLCQCQACLLSDGSSAKPNGVITLL